MYANRVKNGVRGTVYGIANILFILPAIIALIIGGFIVTSFGGLTASGIRLLYTMQSVTLLLTWIFVFKFFEGENNALTRNSKLSFDN